MATNFNFLGMPGAPATIRSVLKGSIYAAILDSVAAHSSLIVQVLKSNLSAGAACVLVTKMPPSEFLSMAEMSGVDFRDDIAQGRLYLFSRQGDFEANIFRHGVGHLFREFEYFQVPRESFFLFDQAGDLFTLSDQDLAQTQAMDYRNWMKSAGNTSLFLFPSGDEKIPQCILSYFNGVARIIQSKTAIELQIDFWYSQEGAIAAKAFPVSFDPSGLIRINVSNERGVDDHDMEPFKKTALAPTVYRLLRRQATRISLSKRAKRLQQLAVAPNTPSSFAGRGSQHKRDEKL